MLVAQSKEQPWQLGPGCLTNVYILYVFSEVCGTCCLKVSFLTYFSSPIRVLFTEKNKKRKERKGGQGRGGERRGEERKKERKEKDKKRKTSSLPTKEEPKYLAWISNLFMIWSNSTSLVVFFIIFSHVTYYHTVAHCRLFVNFVGQFYI